MTKKQIVCIGGGTGTHTVLRGLKRYQKQLDLSAVITMADSGGSTGRLRDEFGQLPVGDARMALAALARDIDGHDELIRKLLLYRFDKGDGLFGHNLGNLLLVALTDILGSEELAIRAAAKVLRVQGNVIPVTTEPVDLIATYADGVTITGEHEIDEPAADRSAVPITALTTTPGTTISERAEEVILDADMIVIGPGDLYTSVLANIVIDGMPEAICNSQATVVYICNLATKAGQTLGMGAQEHINEIQTYLGCSFDVALVNTGTFPEELSRKYAEALEFPVERNCTHSNTLRVIEKDFLAKEHVQTTKGDVLKRSLIRHDSRTLARTLMGLL